MKAGKRSRQNGWGRLCWIGTGNEKAAAEKNVHEVTVGRLEDYTWVQRVAHANITSDVLYIKNTSREAGRVCRVSEWQKSGSIQLLCNVNYHYKQPLLSVCFKEQLVGSHFPRSDPAQGTERSVPQLLFDTVLTFPSRFHSGFTALFNTRRGRCSPCCVRPAHHYTLLLMSACTHELYILFCWTQNAAESV